MTKALLAGVLMVTLCACGSGRDALHDMSGAGDGPDAFSVLPTAPLSMPNDMTALPTPTPGSRNLVDPNPLDDAVIALGGRPSAAVAGGIPARDSALVRAASRYGVPGDIRASLAAEDAAFRKRKGGWGLFNIFGGSRYFAAYAAYRLDAYAELMRLRKLGVETPTAPPQ